MSSSPIDSDYFCLHCGQNLRGVASDRCPECGKPFDRTQTPFEISWESRRSMNFLLRVAAFVATAWIVLRRPKKLLNLNSPAVTLPRARSFRWITVIVLFASIAAWGETWFLNLDPQSSTKTFATSRSGIPSDLLDWLRIPTVFHVAIGTLPLLLWMLTGIGPSAFASSKVSAARRRQSVAIALYSNALLLWTVVLVALALYIRSMSEWDNPWFADSNNITIAFYVTAAALLFWLIHAWLAIFRLLNRVGGSATIVVAFAVAGPVLSLFVWLAFFFTAQALILLFVLMKARW